MHKAKRSSDARAPGSPGAEAGAEAPAVFDLGPGGAGDLRSAALAGLSAPQKHIPCKFLYDDRGSELFDAICELEAYYPTRAELALLSRHRRELAAAVGSGRALVDLGSGSSRKLGALLDAAPDPAAYIPVDISRDYLRAAAERVAARHPDLPVFPVCADYTERIELPPGAPDAPALLFFPGSTIGNFPPSDASAFLLRLRRLVGSAGALLIGVDTEKDPRILEAAYDDPEGLTAAFNLNLLARLNRELGADFDLEAFSHRAVYNADRGCVEMHIASERDQEVAIAGRRFSFRAGETIHTEDAHKYAPARFRDLARESGWDPALSFVGPGGEFSVHLLEPEVACGKIL